MPNFTNNYNLKKPLKTEIYNIDDHNDNMDILDGIINAHLVEDATQAHLPKNVGLGNVDNVKQASKTEFDSHDNDTTKHITSTERTDWTDKETPTGAQAKADTAESNAKAYVDGKVLTDVPVNAKFTDTVYSHPSSHPASMITESATKRFVSDSEKATWNSNSGTDTVTTVNGKTGAISKADIVALGIPSQDTVYTHPITHSISEVSGLQTALDGKIDDSRVLTNVPLNAKFTDTDTTYGVATTSSSGLMSSTDKTNLDSNTTERHTHSNKSVIDKFTEVDNKPFYNGEEIGGGSGALSLTEITTDEIDAGTSTTLRAITARRLKYLLDKIVALFPTKTSELTNDSGFLTSATKSDVGLGNVDNIKQMPISNGVLENYREKLVTLSGTSTAINLSLGNVFTHALSGNTTYTISNAVSGQAHSFTLIISQPATARTLTFPASVKWQGGEIPDLTTANKTYILTFMTVDGGTTWLGMFGGEF